MILRQQCAGDLRLSSVLWPSGAKSVQLSPKESTHPRSVPGSTQTGSEWRLESSRGQHIGPVPPPLVGPLSLWSLAEYDARAPPAEGSTLPRLFFPVRLTGLSRSSGPSG